MVKQKHSGESGEQARKVKDSQQHKQAIRPVVFKR
jgi:hypothetical protein